MSCMARRIRMAPAVGALFWAISAGAGVPCQSPAQSGLCSLFWANMTPERVSAIDPDARYIVGLRPLQLAAAFSGDPALIDALLEAGAPLEGRDGPANHKRLCVKGRYGFDYVHHRNRLTKPLIRREGVKKELRNDFDPGKPEEIFREATWEEALDRAADGLKRIRDEGRAGFYEGETADRIVAEMERGGGLISHADLQDYTAVERPPVRASYRGYNVISMGPPSSGGVALAQLFNAVEPHDIGAMGYQSSEAAHLMGEAMRRVYADRAKWLGDPDHVDVPTEGLIRKSYMQERMANYDSSRITPSDSVAAGEPMIASESMETTHYSVADSSGMAVSVTTTINSGYGSKVVVDGAGFFMNNEMNDFVLKPGVPNQFGLSGTERNLVAPDRRMVSSMSPTIVENPDGGLFMVIGAPGGSTIITTTFQVIMNVIDHGMDIERAVAAGRVHHQWKPRVLSYEENTLPKDVVWNLRARGWPVTMGVFGGIPRWGRAQGIHVKHPADRPAVKREFYGGADPRSEGAAVGF